MLLDFSLRHFLHDLIFNLILYNLILYNLILYTGKWRSRSRGVATASGCPGSPRPTCAQALRWVQTFLFLFIYLFFFLRTFLFFNFFFEGLFFIYFFF